jgi:hypothetical protein
MTDFRTLCADLLQEFASLYSEMSARVDFNETYTERVDKLLDRTSTALAQPEQDDKTLKSIRATTPRYRMSVIVSTNDSAIDTRMNVIWQALDLSKEILESVSLPEQLPPLGNQ